MCRCCSAHQHWQKKAEERKWLELFNDPAQWWDNRGNLRMRNHPHFKHVSTGRGLWINSQHRPEWALQKLKSLKDPSPDSTARAEYAATSSSESRYNDSSDSSLLITDLRECGASKDLEKGIQIHAQAISSSLAANIHVATSLINMYALCGSMRDARQVFDALVHPNLVAWNCLLWGYVYNGSCEQALQLFDQIIMQQKQKGGIDPEARTFVAVISACAALAKKEDQQEQWYRKGKALHSEAAIRGFLSDKYVISGLINMYAKCGRMDDARQVFDAITPDAATWTALMIGYVDNGNSELAVEVFEEFGKVVEADGGVFVAALSACAASARKEICSSSRYWFERGKAVHALAAASECCGDRFVGSTLVDFYAKCGRMVEARCVFDGMPLLRAVVAAWNALVTGYVDNGENESALSLILGMETDTAAADPNATTLAAALRACGNLSAAGSGRSFHADISRRGLEEDETVIKSLISFYGKCGSLENAIRIFDAASDHSVRLWNSLIAAHDCGRSVVELFESMQEEGVQPDELTLICTLTACSHAGLVEKGRDVFHAMQSRFSITPTLEHYNCVVDLLCRGDFVDEAITVVETMPFQPRAETWRIILGACGKWKNAVVGRAAYQSLLRLDAGYAAAYVMMASIVEGAETRS